MKILLTALGLLASSAALAETVTIRTGEHPGFTRVVFYYPADASWQVERREGSAVMRFSGDVTGFDTATAFDRIPRERLTQLTPTARNALSLTLGCDCPVQSFQHAPGVAVIDLRDGIRNASATAPSNRERLSFALNLAEPVDPLQGADSPALGFYLAGSAQNSFGVERTPDTGRRDTPPTPRPRARAARPDEQRGVTDPSETADDFLGLRRRERVIEAEQRLLEQLIRGVAQGSLQADFDPALADQPSQNAIPSGDTAARPARTSAFAILPDETGEQRREVPLRAETSIDRDIAEAEEAIRARGCLPPREVDFTGRADGPSFSAALSNARRAQALASADAAMQAAEMVAVTYLYWGFGAEARKIALDSNLSRSRAEQIAAMGEIIDHGHTDRISAIRAHPGCDGPSALWALMAPEEWPGAARVNGRAVLAAFNAMPSHLRRQMGQRLITRLIDADSVDTAQEIQRILIREQPESSPALQLSQARIALVGGDAELSEAELTEIARGGSDQAAFALLDLSTLMLNRGENIPGDLTDLLGTYAFENRRTDLGDRLFANQARAFARDGKAQPALALIEGELSTSGLDMTAFRSEIFGTLAQWAEDERFLRLALTEIHALREALSIKDGNEVAKRLLALGFPDQAVAFLEREATGAEHVARQLLRAETALQLRNPADAEMALLGIENDTAERMRAVATAMRRDYRVAYDAFSALGAAQEADRQAVRAQDWERLSDSEDGVLRRAAEAALSEPELDTASPVPSLAQSQQLIENSRSTRTALEDMVTRFSAPGSLP